MVARRERGVAVRPGGMEGGVKRDAGGPTSERPKDVRILLRGAMKKLSTPRRTRRRRALSTWSRQTELGGYRGRAGLAESGSSRSRVSLEGDHASTPKRGQTVEHANARCESAPELQERNRRHLCLFVPGDVGGQDGERKCGEAVHGGEPDELGRQAGRLPCDTVQERNEYMSV